MAITFQLALSKENDRFLASDAFTHVSSTGKSYDEAISNLKEALSLYYEGMSEDEIKDSRNILEFKEVEMSLNAS